MNTIERNQASKGVEPGSDEAPQVVKSTTRARQGVTGHNVRYVLGWSFAGAVLLLGLLWLIYWR